MAGIFTRGYLEKHFVRNLDSGNTMEKSHVIACKGYIVCERHDNFLDFCRDVHFNHREYYHVQRIDHLMGIGHNQDNLPVYLVAFGRPGRSREFMNMLDSPHYHSFLMNASVVLKPRCGGKWD